MNNIKWLLTLQKTKVLSKGETIDTLESYTFDFKQDAEEAMFRIDKVGVWDRMDENGAGEYYNSIKLEPKHTL